MAILRKLLTTILSITMIAVGLQSVSATAADAVPDTLGRVVSLEEITVKPRKEKYSKKNNPAVDFAERIRKASTLTDPLLHDNYNYETYERITLAFNDLQDSIGNDKGIMKQFKFLNQYVDTSEVTGRPILPISVKERVKEVFNRKSPKAMREYIIGAKEEGLDEVFNPEAIRTYLDDMFREIDLYQNDITLLSNRFVSPLSKIGPDFYKYYLTDTISVGADSCAVLAFAPRNSATFGFVGHLYVSLRDSTLFIPKVSMYLPHKANVNFIETLNIEQTFERGPGGERLKSSDILTIEFSLIPGTQGIYAQRVSRYRDHNFDQPTRSDIFKRLGTTTLAADSYLKDDTFWAARRDETFRPVHAAMGQMISDMRSVPAYYWAEKVLKVVVSGYVPLTKKGKIEYGPVNTTVSFNDIEGTRLRAGYMTTGNLSQHWFSRGYAAYGTKDHRWKYYGEFEYSFRPKKRHSREFPIHSLKLSYRYDIDAIGQDYAFTNPDNIFLSFKRMPDTLGVYKRDGRLDYWLELENNFSVKASASLSKLYATKYVPFAFADGTHLKSMAFSEFSVSLRYAPGEKFMQTRSYRFPVNLDAPVFMLTQTYSPANFLGSGKYVVNKTEVMLQKRFWLSAFGYIDILAKGGHVWSTTPFTHLFSPNANLSYTIQPESYALLSPLEFICDSYASVDLTYWANGTIFNYIPLLKKLKWREVFSCRGYWGDLSDKNDPAKNTWLPQFPVGTNPVSFGSKPYLEASVGIDNVLRILRVDYVWRLTYRDTPGIDRRGLRVSLHFNF